MLKLLLIATFGGLGSVLRYGIARGVQASFGGRFPVGTLTVNLVGCLVIGFSGAFFLANRQTPEEHRLAIMVGLLGGFTTFSAFAWETRWLVVDASATSALANLVLSNVLGLVCVELGYRLGVRLFGA